MGNKSSISCIACNTAADRRLTANGEDLEAQAEDILDETLPEHTSAKPPERVTLRDDEIQKIMEVWTRKQREREDKDDTLFCPERQFSMALLMNDEALASRLLHHISDEEILRKLYMNPLCTYEVKQVVIKRAKEIATKKFGLSHSYVGHRVRTENSRYKLDDVIVGFSSWVSDVEIANVIGMNVEIRNYRYVDGEALKVEKLRMKAQDELTDAESEMLRSCIRKYSTRLWRRHSNLNMISACSVKSKNRGAHIRRQPCIVLYCSVKGVIPLLEKPFPKMLRSSDGIDVPVDIREGYFQFATSTIDNASVTTHTTKSETTEIPEVITDPVFVGESFKTRALNKEGTIGPFVELPNGKTGFLTCAHTVFDCSRQVDFQYPQNSVLPNDVSLRVICGDSTDIKEKQVQCKVLQAVFSTRSDEKSKREINLDAALVELAENLRGDCDLRIDDETQVLQCGYEDADCLEYRTGELVKKMNDNYRHLSVIKCGAATGLTKGVLKVDGVQVKNADFRFTSNGKPWTYESHSQVLQGQYEISSRCETTFIGPGDSGASVYVKGRYGELYCIGIAIGYTSYSSAIVTPILPILRKFELCERYLMKFPEESSDESEVESENVESHISVRIRRAKERQERRARRASILSRLTRSTLSSRAKSRSPLDIKTPRSSLVSSRVTHVNNRKDPDDTESKSLPATPPSSRHAEDPKQDSVPDDNKLQGDQVTTQVPPSILKKSKCEGVEKREPNSDIGQNISSQKPIKSILRKSAENEQKGQTLNNTKSNVQNKVAPNTPSSVLRKKEDGSERSRQNSESNESFGKKAPKTPPSILHKKEGGSERSRQNSGSNDSQSNKGHKTPPSVTHQKENESEGSRQISQPDESQERKSKKSPSSRQNTASSITSTLSANRAKHMPYKPSVTILTNRSKSAASGARSQTSDDVKRPTTSDDVKRPTTSDDVKRPTKSDDVKRPTTSENVTKPNCIEHSKPLENRVKENAFEHPKTIEDTAVLNSTGQLKTSDNITKSNAKKNPMISKSPTQPNVTVQSKKSESSKKSTVTVGSTTFSKTKRNATRSSTPSSSHSNKTPSTHSHS